LDNNNQPISDSEVTRLEERIEIIRTELTALQRALQAQRARRDTAPSFKMLPEALLRRFAAVKLCCDEPAEGATVASGEPVVIRGWALAQKGIASLEAQIDDQPPIPLSYGTLRPDVQQAFSSIPRAEHSGFDFIWNTSGLRPGAHCVRIAARSLAGEHATLTRVLTLSAPTVMRLFCDTPAGTIELGPGSRLRISGWCLAHSAIRRIEYSIDDAPFTALPYGIPRPDVRDAFPEYGDTDHRGFLCEAEGVPAGEHRLIVTARSESGESAVLSQNFFVRPFQEANLLLHCDYPVTRSCHSVRDVVELRGWALAWSGLRDVTVQIGDMPRLAASYGWTRPDVAQVYPQFPQPERSGWRFIWDTTAVPEGHYQIRITATAMDGAATTLTPRVLVDQRCDTAYSEWIAQNEPTPEEKEKMVTDIDSFERRPIISILVPVYKTPPHLLSRCIDSVRAQLYPFWELCLADDGSQDSELAELLTHYSHLDSRIRFSTLTQNSGISAATNAALRMATGNYVAFLDSDDELADFAVWEVVTSINADPAPDLFYSDEDKLDEVGRRYDWFFKPDWSPELFFSCNYLCHFIVIRRWVLDQVGGLDESFRGGTQDYEFLLRVIERTTRIRRIPKVLYHWRATEGSTAKTADEKPGAGLNGRRALQEYMSRNQPGTSVEQIASCRYRVHYPIQGSPTVDILMPTGGKMNLLRRAVEDVLQKTDYHSFQITFIDNSSQDRVQQYARTLVSNGSPVKYLDWQHKRFNFSLMNNSAVRQSTAPYVLFLNDDISVVTSEWLSAMLEHAQRPEIAAVGAQLWYPNDAIQHAGVVMGIYRNSGHAFRKLPVTRRGHGQYFDFPWLIRNCAAVTAACMLVATAKFWEVGGFDEDHLSVAFQDVDLCLKLLEKGYRNVYVPDAVLYHYESATKAEVQPNPVEDHFMKRKWKRYIDDDPYYNPNLTRDSEDYRLRLR